MKMTRPAMTIEELLASDDPEDAKFLEDLWLTGGDPNYDPEDGWPGEDQSEGDIDCERDA